MDNVESRDVLIVKCAIVYSSVDIYAGVSHPRPRVLVNAVKAWMEFGFQGSKSS